jgi:hypothetical protein
LIPTQEDEKAYYEINSVEWWQNVMNNEIWKEKDLVALGIILYTDGTSTGHFKNKTLKPVYLT